MQRILIVGCGDIALRAAKLLRGRFRVFGVVRRKERFGNLRGAGMVPLLADLDTPSSLRKLAGLADAVLHLAPPPGMGARDTRTRQLLAALSRNTPPKRLVYVSTSGVYGDCGGALVSETRALNPQTERAKRRVDAERAIRSWAARNGAAAMIVRVPGIYAADRLPLDRLRAGAPAIEAVQDGYTNHIHADDLARVIVAAMQRGRPNRVYHASDDSQTKMGDYFDMVADTHGLARPPRLPRDAVERAVSPALWSFMNESRRLTNDRMKRELGVRLRYPTVADALKRT
jgi:nucleoside-diphosphate-sugar epimerase